ncbi:MAG: glycosyltransferase family 2 protein [Candidatus Pacearchaeota archaeon]
MKLSVVIPCYNEEGCIKNTLIKINKFLKKNKKVEDYEIICVDDGSLDSTREIITKIMRSNAHIKINRKRENKGKGFSVKEGILLARFPYILVSDADLSTPITELNKFLDCLDYDIVIGSRNLRESIVKRSLIRKITGRIYAKIVQLVLGLGFKDTQCGFKLFKKDVAKELVKKQKINGFAFDAELLFLAKKKNYKIIEIPVKWKEAKKTSINLLKHGFIMLKDVLRIKFYCLRLCCD